NDDDDGEKDEEDEDEEEHLALADPSAVPTDDPVNTETFETDKSASTPPNSPHHIILSFETKSRAVQMSI
ncbi:hypothetical protein Tco_0354451, partial [Tanacetum coccineum]